MTLVSNPSRTAKIIEILMDWYYSKQDKIFTNAYLPESEPPSGVTRGSDEHLLWITLTVAIDYQRNAKQLWKAGQDTWYDEETRWVYYPSEVVKKEIEILQTSLQKYKLSKKPIKDADTWYDICKSFYDFFHGNPKELIQSCNFDALQLYYYMRSNSRKFPFLGGGSAKSKILSLWIRILHEEVGLNLSNLEKVPIPIDTHTARATVTTGCLVGEFDNRDKNFIDMCQDAWIEACDYLNTKNNEKKFYPLQLDGPLWNLSRLGCSSREDGNSCPVKDECDLSKFCTANSSDAIIRTMKHGGTTIKTTYPETL